MAASPHQRELSAGPTVFAGTGLVRHDRATSEAIELMADPGAPIVDRLMDGRYFGPLGLNELLHARPHPAPRTAPSPTALTLAAGKNTYTYDAHTYHTKVPPQAIAAMLEAYLPDGGLVLDPFAGSGMTGVAALTTGHDVVLNELSPAATFISHCFTASVDSSRFQAAVDAVIQACSSIREELWTTTCRECSRPTELLYAVWSYRVQCPHCDSPFTLWDHCRSYGRTVRDHRLLREFPCPECRSVVKKRSLQRLEAVPVLVGYRCCTKGLQEQMAPPSAQDLALILEVDNGSHLAEGFFPVTEVPPGINLSQPRRHGLTSVDKFYTTRSLASLSHLWRATHRVEDVDLAAAVAFVSTSLYQRVTKLSEFRFWGGSGNTARFNVPYIYNESNVFISFERKARTIRDHLDTTARGYRGRRVVRNGSATDLREIPDGAVDLVFTDPPFGANINYSEMNILWESWLGHFTETREEAIISKAQGKDTADYGDLLRRSFEECRRVLRDDGWLLVVFMNSSASVWEALRDAIRQAGFVIEAGSILDKRHGTFKQFVSANAAGSDLVLHCRKVAGDAIADQSPPRPGDVALQRFLDGVSLDRYKTTFLHVDREDELDVRTLYSEWLALCLLNDLTPLDFARFREAAEGRLRGPR